MAMSVRPGDWFLGARCECGAWIVIDKSDGPAFAVTLPAKLHLTCEACGKPATYAREVVRHSHVRRYDRQ
jgi:hypothetical protein